MTSAQNRPQQSSGNNWIMLFLVGILFLASCTALQPVVTDSNNNENNDLPEIEGENTTKKDNETEPKDTNTNTKPPKDDTNNTKDSKTSNSPSVNDKRNSSFVPNNKINFTGNSWDSNPRPCR